MRDKGYSSRPVCLCVCVRFSTLPSCTFGHPMRDISGQSTENAVKLKAVFSKTAYFKKLEAL